MADNRLTQDDLTFKLLTPQEWPDFEALFEEHGPQNGWRRGNDDSRRRCR
jgi:hypothetical protein